MTYASSSPDEECLTAAAHRLHATLLRRDRSSVEISINGELERYEILHELPFSSQRKRMSVLLRHTASQRITLTVKGADDVIWPRLRADQKQQLGKLGATLTAYATSGLRTLCFASKRVTDDEFAAWRKLVARAETLVQNRTETLAALYNELENNLVVDGVTGIEDCLQPRVPETIQLLRDAGIRVWMLTGDKYETALEVARTCNLIRESREEEKKHGNSSIGCDCVVTLPQHCSADTICADLLGADEKQQLQGGSFVLVVRGSALTLAVACAPAEFFALASRAASVVCCRVTPAQKAAIVRLVKQRSAGRQVTLAIGDGGNDVAMIQEADIGVGISGREGLQAARAADFSFAQFSSLARLCLVHGRYSYNCIAFLAKYCFYKSIVICMIQLMFGVLSGFSGASFFGSFSLMTYNVFYTSLPVLFYCFERDLSPAFLLQHPRLYPVAPAPHGARHFTFRQLAGWTLTAVLQAAAIALVIFQTTHGKQGTAAFGASGQVSTALTAYTCCVFVQTGMMLLETSYFTVYNHIVIWGTLALFFLFNSLAALVPSISLYGVVFVLFGDAVFWLRVLLAVCLCLLPVFGVRFVQRYYTPSVSQYAREVELAAKKQ
jgi:phospholipid-translocating ATPase